MRRKLLGLAVATAAAVALPLQAAATINMNFTYTPSPLTHNTDSYVTSAYDVDGGKTLKSSETVLPFDEHIFHHGDTGTPADNTQIGTGTATALWLSNFCISRTTQNFNIFWIAPDGGFTPPAGWTVIAEVQIKSSSSLFNVTFDGYAIEDASGNQKVEVPSYPNLSCTRAGTTNHITQVLGHVGSTTYHVHRNPTTVNTFTVSISVTYTDGSHDNGSTTYTTT